jgi:replication initiation protein RepC
METLCAPEAPRNPAGKVPSGLRRLSLAMLATEHAAEAFTGLPEAGRHGQVLAAFKAAAPYLGIAPRAVHAVDWLFKFTQAQDWGEGSRPIVWPSASMQQEALGLGPTQVKTLNRYLTEAGLITMKDSPNGKRYGRRNPKGRILEAYGFDLSPLAARQAEFLALAAQGKAVRDRMRHLRRRSTIARNGLLQIMETVAELDLGDATWTKLAEEGRTAGADGTRRRFARTPAARGSREAGKAVCRGKPGGAGKCEFRPQGAGKPAPYYNYKPAFESCGYRNGIRRK